MTLTEESFTAQRFTRSARRARSDGPDHYSFLLHRRGTWRAAADEKHIASAPGRVCVLDFAYPAVSEVTWNDSITISLSRAVLDEVLPGRNLHGLTLDGTRGGLLHGFLGSLATPARGASAVEPEPVIARHVTARRPCDEASPPAQGLAASQALLAMTREILRFQSALECSGSGSSVVRDSGGRRQPSRHRTHIERYTGSTHADPRQTGHRLPPRTAPWRTDRDVTPPLDAPPSHSASKSPARRESPRPASAGQ